MSSDQDYKFVFRLKKNPGLDRVNDIAVSGMEDLVLVNEQNSDDTLMNVHVEHVVNKWRVGSNTTLIIVLIALALLIVFSRISHPAFGVKRIYLTNDSTQRTINVKGAGRVLLTSDKKKSQSFFKTVFVRKTVFVVDDFFSAGDILIEPKFRINTDSGRRNGVRLSGKSYDIPNKNLAKDQEGTISHFDTNSTINIKIQ